MIIIASTLVVSMNLTNIIEKSEQAVQGSRLASAKVTIAMYALLNIQPQDVDGVVKNAVVDNQNNIMDESSYKNVLEKSGFNSNDYVIVVNKCGFVDNILLKEGKSYIVKNTTQNIYYDNMLEALEQANANDIIEITGGKFDFTESGLVIDKPLTIKGVSAKSKPVFLLETSDGTGELNTIKSGIIIKSDNVVLSNLILKISEGCFSTGNLISIPYRSQLYTGIVLDNCEFYGSNHSVQIHANNMNIRNCIFIGRAQRKHGISFYSAQNSSISGNIIIRNNIFEDIYKGIVHESTIPYSNVNVEISGNIFENYKKKAVSVDNGEYLSYVVKENVFSIPTGDTVIIDNGVNFPVDANDNYFGEEQPVKSNIFEGNVNAISYYIDESKTSKQQW